MGLRGAKGNRQTCNNYLCLVHTHLAHLPEKLKSKDIKSVNLKGLLCRFYVIIHCKYLISFCHDSSLRSDRKIDLFKLTLQVVDKTKIQPRFSVPSGTEYVRSGLGSSTPMWLLSWWLNAGNLEC